MAQNPSGINAPNNSGIITQGQSGGTNIIYQGPRPWNLLKIDADRIAAAAKSSTQHISKFIIRYAPMDANAQNFAWQLRQALVDGGLTEQDMPTPLGIDMLGVDLIPSGNIFYIKSKDAMPSVGGIMMALRDSHIPVIRHVMLDAGLPDRSLAIKVGKNDVPPSSPDLLR